jgi:hypothetical protein
VLAHQHRHVALDSADGLDAALQQIEAQTQRLGPQTPVLKERCEALHVAELRRKHSDVIGTRTDSRRSRCRRGGSSTTAATAGDANAGRTTDDRSGRCV